MTDATSKRSESGKAQRNNFALVALLCGIASWVPWIVVFMAPFTYVFAILAIVSAKFSGNRYGISAAWFGMLLATISLALQFGLVLIATLVGWIGGA